MADREGKFEGAADPYQQDLGHASSSVDNVLFGAFSDVLGADQDRDEFDFIRLSSGSSGSARDERLETPGIDGSSTDLQPRFADFAPEDGVPDDGGQSEFQDMVDRRLAQMADGGGARLINPGAAIGETSPGSSGMTMAELQDRLAGVAFRYEQEKRNATLDADMQARYLDEELKLLNEYERNPARPLNEERQVIFERMESFLEAERKILKENGAPPSLGEPAPQPEDPDEPEDGGSPVSPHVVLEVDLPEGFDNVGEFELIG